MFLFSLVAFSYAQVRYPEAATGMTVCQVLDNLAQLKDTTLEIRGGWRGGHLWADCPTLQLDESFLSGIAVLMPHDPSLRQVSDWAYSDVQYAADRENVTRLLANNLGKMATANLFGKLEVFDEPYRSSASVRPVYGTPLSTFRAALVLREVRSVSLVEIVPINSTPLSVCQILAMREQYRGQFVMIRGEFDAAAMVLEQQCSPLKTDNFQWSTRITLEGPRLNSDVPSSWHLEPEALKRVIEEDLRLSGGKLEQTVDGQMRTGRQRKVLATIVGRFDSRQLEVQGARYGYGHLNDFPARVIVVHIADLTAVQ